MKIPLTDGYIVIFENEPHVRVESKVYGTLVIPLDQESIELLKERPSTDKVSGTINSFYATNADNISYNKMTFHIDFLMHSNYL